MFAEVALHRKVPKGFDTFTYEIPVGVTVSPGQLVIVPFRNQRLSGVVRTLHNNEPRYFTKTLSSVSSLLLGQKQLELAQWMAEKYNCSFSKSIDLFIPEKIWNADSLHLDDKAPSLRSGVQSEVKQAATQALSDFAKKLTATPTKKLILEKTVLPRREFYAALQKHMQSENCAFYIFPEALYAQQCVPHLPHFHGGLKEKEKATLWKAVYDGTLKTVAGTRGALFLPFKKLSLIVVDFEHHEQYREKRVPQYETVEVAEKIAQQHGCPLIVISSAPRTETFYQTTTGAFETHIWQDTSDTTLTIIDMADERRKGVTGIFAEKTITGVAAALSQDKQVLLFVNRTGKASALLCKDCSAIVSCPICRSTLTLHKDDILRCHRCKTSIAMPEVCTPCGSSTLKKIGFGTERVEDEIKKIFGKARVERLDSTTLSRRQRREVLMNEKKLGQADILIATALINKPVTIPRLSLVVALMPDGMLQFTDFRAEEKLLQLLTQLKHLPMPGGQMIIQTLMPEHRVYKTLQENALEDFYAEELLTRKTLSLPPFVILQQK